MNLLNIVVPSSILILRLHLLTLIWEELSSSTFCRTNTTTILAVYQRRVFSTVLSQKQLISWHYYYWNEIGQRLGRIWKAVKNAISNRTFLQRIQDCSATNIMANESVTPEWDVFFQTNPAPPDINLEETRIKDFLTGSSSTDNPCQPICLVTSGNIHQKFRKQTLFLFVQGGTTVPLEVNTVRSVNHALITWIISFS